jgi:zinc transporter 2
MSHSHGHHGHDHGHGESSSGAEPCAAAASSSSSDLGAAAADKDQRRFVLRRLKIASFLCCTFFLVEVVGGLLAGSLAILSDAAHLFADLAAFVVAIAASHLASLPPSSDFTFGYKRTEALAALFSMASLAIVSIFLLVEGVRRLWPFMFGGMAGEQAAAVDHELDVDGGLMSLIAFIGVVVNVILAFVLGEHHVHLPGGDHGHSHEHEHGHSHGHDHHGGSCGGGNGGSEEEGLLLSDIPKTPERNGTNGGSGNDSKAMYGTPGSSAALERLHTDEVPHSHAAVQHEHHGEKKRNINLHAAYIHVLGDLAQSVAVLIAGLTIWWKPEWRAIDPICTILFCMVVFYSTIGVIRSSISVLLEEVPPHVDWDDVFRDISAVPGVFNVHDLHIWSISHGFVAISVHASADDPDGALQKIEAVCSRHGIGHSTIQLQSASGGADCITCGPGMLHCM